MSQSSEEFLEEQVFALAEAIREKDARIAELERLLAAPPAAPAQSLKSCQTGWGDICHMAKHDGVTCPDDSCDIDDSIRAAPQPFQTAKPGEPVQDEKEWAEGICQSRHEQDAWWKPYAAAADAVSKSADVWQGFGIQDARVCVDAYLSAKGSRDE